MVLRIRRRALTRKVKKFNPIVIKKRPGRGARRVIADPSHALVVLPPEEPRTRIGRQCFKLLELGAAQFTGFPFIILCANQIIIFACRLHRMESMLSQRLNRVPSSRELREGQRAGQRNGCALPKSQQQTFSKKLLHLLPKRGITFIP